jgi:hypothetical protein
MVPAVYSVPFPGRDRRDKIQTRPAATYRLATPTRFCFRAGLSPPQHKLVPGTGSQLAQRCPDLICRPSERAETRCDLWENLGSIGRTPGRDLVDGRSVRRYM